MFEMLAGRSPFDIVGNADHPDQNTEDYLFQGQYRFYYEVVISSNVTEYLVGNTKGYVNLFGG